MTQRVDVLSFGEMLLRLSPAKGERLIQSNRLTVYVGGAEANVAAGLARLGRQCAMLTVLPNDELGQAAVDALRLHGVDTSRVQLVNRHRMGLYWASPGAGLMASRIQYDRGGSAFSETSPDAIDWDTALDGVSWLHLSGITAAVSEYAAKSARRAVVAASRKNVSVSFDGNYRATLWQGREHLAPAILTSLLKHAELAFIDARDIGLILGEQFHGAAHDTPESVTRAAMQRAFATFPNLRRIACTVREMTSVTSCSLRASLFCSDGSHFDSPEIHIADIVERIGAGDAFAAGFLCAQLEGVNNVEQLTFALYCAAAKHGQCGDMGWLGREEVLALIASRSFDIRR